MTHPRKLSERRRGVSAVQAAVVLAVLTLVIVAALRTMGTSARTNLNTSAGNVANPASLPSRFGS
jgi:Tfp pilus assembly protein PilX